MTRGLPISLIIHGLAISLALIFGNSVHQRKFDVPRTIGVRIVELPKIQVNEQEKTDAIIPMEPPKLQEQPAEELPPKEIPKPKPDPPKESKSEEKRVEIPKQDVVDADEIPAEDPDSSVLPLTTGTSVAGTDSDFPFSWYLAVMEGQVARNWNPRQMGFRNDAGVSCVLHFTIQHNGSVTQITMTRSSGIGVYDREALRAIQSTRLPQLPPDFGATSLGVTMTFNLESGDR